MSLVLDYWPMLYDARGLPAGLIPTALGGLTSLEMLGLEDNKLSGERSNGGSWRYTSYP